MDRDFKGVWIPKEIWLNSNLTITEKCLLVEIESLSKNGECFASNEHFAEFLGMHKNNVSRMITSLIEKGYLKKINIYKKDSKLVEKRILTTLKPSEEIREYPNDTTQYQNDSDQYQNDIEQYHNDSDQYQNDITLYQNVKDNNTFNNTFNNTSNNSIKNNKKINKKDQLEAEFEELWKTYPRKLGDKKKAKKSYIEAVKKGEATYEAVKYGIEMYIKYNEYHNVAEEYIKHGSTWFNQHCWNNDFSCKPKKIQGKRQGVLGMMLNEMDYQRANIIEYEGALNHGETRNQEAIGYVSSTLPF